jgi:hypothetical protein
MIFGALFVIAAGGIGPSASTYRFGLLHGVAPWIVVTVVALGGFVLFVQGLGTFLLRRNRN